MAAYAALVSLLNILEQIKNHPHLFTSFDKDQIESLGQKIDLFLGFVGTYNSYEGVGKEELKELEGQIVSAAHEAEDVIEFHIVNQILPGYSQIISGIRLHHICLYRLEKVIIAMDSIKDEVLKLKEERKFNVQKPANSMSAASSTSLTTGKSSMVGFDDELKQLMDVLTGQQSCRQIISIVGMGGAGKTTLVRNVYEDSVIMHHFDLCSWATISQEYDVREIFSQLLSLQGKLTNETAYELGERLHKSLVGRRYLIVLDDIWCIEVWDSIKFYFPDNGNGSRVVLTSRMSNVATRLRSFCIRINFLDEHESWNLFCQEIFRQEECPPKLVSIGKKIVEQCKGLPLSIVVIGGLLRKSHRTVEYWYDVAININSILYSRENGQCLDILYLSYSHLPAHLKPCFLYMGTYLEDHEIRVSEIIKLWVAEGFLKPNGVQMLEEMAEDYLKDLIDRNLILVSGHRSNGKIRSFRIHDLLRELCLSVADKENFFCVLRPHSIPRGIGKERRLIFHDVTSSSRNNEVFKALYSASLARSLICSVSEVPVGCRLLRVVKKAFNWCLEAEHQIVNLRYISYRSNWDGSMLPSSISLIWNLQTLIIKRRNRTIVPMEIWKMPTLRHVKGSLILFPDPPRSHQDDDSVVLGNLQTFKAVMNFRLSEEACKRIPNIKKLHLMYGDIWKGYDDGLYENLQNLSRLHKLESLHIECSQTTPLLSNDLKNAFPSSLNKLFLEDCGLHWQDLSMIIGSLPQLEVLFLRNAFNGKEFKWSCVEGGFLRLKFLKIESCPLIFWTLDNASCFPVLEKIFLVELDDLNDIPSGIGHIPTLQFISLRYCSASAAISAVKIKDEQEIFGNDSLQIKVRVYPDEADRFMEGVKTEGLSINNIIFREA